MEKAVFQWITDSSHLEVQSGVVLTFSPVSPCPPHRRTSLQTNKEPSLGPGAGAAVGALAVGTYSSYIFILYLSLFHGPP